MTTIKYDYDLLHSELMTHFMESKSLKHRLIYSREWKKKPMNHWKRTL